MFGGYAEVCDGPAFEFGSSPPSAPLVRLPTARVRRASQPAPSQWISPAASKALSQSGIKDHWPQRSPRTGGRCGVSSRCCHGAMRSGGTGGRRGPLRPRRAGCPGPGGRRRSQCPPPPYPSYRSSKCGAVTHRPALIADGADEQPRLARRGRAAAARTAAPARSRIEGGSPRAERGRQWRRCPAPALTASAREPGLGT